MTAGEADGPIDRQSFPDLETVKKVMEVPLVSDTVNQVMKITSNVSETINSYSLARQAKEAIGEKLKFMGDPESINKLPGGKSLTQTISDVKDSVMPTLVTTVNNIDQAASKRIDSITEAYPQLNSSAVELMESSRDLAHSKFRGVIEFIASFAIVQFFLRTLGRVLAESEHILKNFNFLPSIQKMIRNFRRYLRSLKRGGIILSRQREEEGLSYAGWTGTIASYLNVNLFIRFFGMQLTLTPQLKERRALELVAKRALRRPEDIPKPSVDGDDDNVGLEALESNLEGYRSEEDPDYEPSSTCSEDSNLEYSSGADQDSEEDQDSENEAEDTTDAVQDEDTKAKKLSWANRPESEQINAGEPSKASLEAKKPSSLHVSDAKKPSSNPGEAKKPTSTEAIVAANEGKKLLSQPDNSSSVKSGISVGN